MQIRYFLLSPSFFLDSMAIMTGVKTIAIKMTRKIISLIFILIIQLNDF